MNAELFSLILSFLTIASFVLSLVFVIGIVWRVELELDLSFKFFSLGIAALLAIGVLELLPFSRLEVWWQWLLPLSKLFASLSLLLGLYFMRDLIRRLDGEKSTTKN